MERAYDPEMDRIRKFLKRRWGFQSELKRIEEEERKMSSGEKVTVGAASESRGCWYGVINLKDWDLKVYARGGFNRCISRLDAERAAKAVCKAAGWDYKK